MHKERKGVRLGCSRCSSSDLSRCIHALVTTTATATLLNCYSYAGLLTFRKIHLSPPPAYPDRNLIVEWRNNQSRTSTQQISRASPSPHRWSLARRHQSVITINGQSSINPDIASGSWLGSTHCRHHHPHHHFDRYSDLSCPSNLKAI